MEVEAGFVGTGTFEDLRGPAFGSEIVDENVDVFNAGEMADDLGVDPGDGLEFVRPVFGVVGPGDPGGGVGRPFGGHAVVPVARYRRFGVHAFIFRLIDLYPFRGIPPG